MKKRIIILLILYVTVLLFFVSIDSYTHNLLGRTDSAFLYTGGKAWMNGMIPYIDFTGTAGPLLWLIYGIGYIISPLNYHGIFWLSCLMYFGVFFFMYKTANIFLKNNHQSFLCSILMTLSLFNPWFHVEMRAEECSLFFLSLLLYSACRILYNEKPYQSTKLSFFYIGISLGATTLISLDIALIHSYIVFYCFYFILREKKSPFHALLSFAGGMLIVLIPFTFIMLWQGNLTPFINDYLKGSLIMEAQRFQLTQYIHYCLATIAQPARMALFSLSLIGSVLMTRYAKREKLFFLLTFLWTYAISIRHADSNYSLSLCLFFPLWFIISTIPHENYSINSKRKSLIISALTLVFIIFFNYTYTDGNVLGSLLFNGEAKAEQEDNEPEGHLVSTLFFTNLKYNNEIYNISKLMSQIDNPTIIYYGMPDIGCGILCEALPGSKYWAEQEGSLNVSEYQKNAILLRGSDFVMIDYACNNVQKKVNVLTKAGYKKCYTYQKRDHHLELFAKHELASIPLSDKIKSSDLFLKNFSYDH